MPAGEEDCAKFLGLLLSNQYILRGLCKLFQVEPDSVKLFKFFCFIDKTSSVQLKLIGKANLRILPKSENNFLFSALASFECNLKDGRKMKCDVELSPDGNYQH